MVKPFPFTASGEANIVETGLNPSGWGWDNTHTGLIDNQGLAGTTQDVDGKVKCGVSLRGSSSVPPYFSLKLAKASRVVKLQLAFRTDHATGQGKNVMVQVGTSPQYNANDPICTEIAQLSGTGLVDYDCNQFHTGQYVIISTDQSVLTICEAKVFVAEAGRVKQCTDLEESSWTPCKATLLKVHQLYLWILYV